MKQTRVRFASWEYLKHRIRFYSITIEHNIIWHYSMARQLSYVHIRHSSREGEWQRMFKTPTHNLPLICAFGSNFCLSDTEAYGYITAFYLCKGKDSPSIAMTQPVMMRPHLICLALKKIEILSCWRLKRLGKHQQQPPSVDERYSKVVRCMLTLQKIIWCMKLARLFYLQMVFLKQKH